MKNYSDLLATDAVIMLELVLRPIMQNGAPHCTVIMNECTMFCQPLTQPVCVRSSVSLVEPIMISITMQDKIYHSDKETAIVITSLKIDQFESVPHWTCLASYRHDQGQGPGSQYLGFNGTWQFSTEMPFYIWRHHATAQGWLLEPTTTTHDCAASSSSTTAKI